MMKIDNFKPDSKSMFMSLAKEGLSLAKKIREKLTQEVISSLDKKVKAEELNT
jgi:hypothetical protein